MTIDELERMLRVADPEPPQVDGLAEAIEDSVRYLESDAALRSIDADTYWPKWHSPWWHMLLLWELGEAQRIPLPVVRAMVAGLNALPLHIFPIHEHDWPPGLDRFRHSTCHCALGSMAQVLGACGIDVARELPWVRPWFARYQMQDGGLNCDESAYLVEGECPSSMVGTVAAFEAMLELDPASAFVERAAQFLIERRLSRGSQTVHNAEERARESDWRQIAFPRFYFYDVLRGASALVRWATIRERTLPLEAIGGVIEHLTRSFPDGIVRVQRQAFVGVGTWQRTSSTWERVPQASLFRLLEMTSAVGQPSPAATRQWTATRHALRALFATGSRRG
jgi:hypothetical protein